MRNNGFIHSCHNGCKGKVHLGQSIFDEVTIRSGLKQRSVLFYILGVY